MVTTKISSSDKLGLYNKLYTACRSSVRRGVSIIVQSYSAKAGSIEIIVDGKNGIVQKNVVVYKHDLEDAWTAVCDNYEYTLSTINELPKVIRSRATAMRVIANKL